MSKVRNLTPEEHDALTTLNERANEFGFSVFYYNKGGLKNAARPWRIGRKKSEYLRFFDTFERLEKYIERIIFEHIEIDKMNASFKIFGSKALFRIAHVGKIPSYVFSVDPSANMMAAGPLTVTASGGFLERKTAGWRSNEKRYADWSRVVQVYHNEIARVQKQREAEA